MWPVLLVPNTHHTYTTFCFIYKAVTSTIRTMATQSCSCFPYRIKLGSMTSIIQTITRTSLDLWLLFHRPCRLQVLRLKRQTWQCFTLLHTYSHVKDAEGTLERISSDPHSTVAPLLGCHPFYAYSIYCESPTAPNSSGKESGSSMSASARIRSTSTSTFMPLMTHTNRCHLRCTN